MAAGLKEMGTLLKRSIKIVNLDPAAESLQYEADIDIRELITVDDVMKVMGLGPNGSLIYCIDFMYENREWVSQKFAKERNIFYIIDLPGQAEVYTVSPKFKMLIKYLEDFLRICTLHCTDSSVVNDVCRYVSACATSLLGFASLQTPSIPVLTKIDLLRNVTRGMPSVPLKYLAIGDGDGDLMPSSLSCAVDAMGALPGMKRWVKLAKALCRVLDDTSGVGLGAPACCSVYDGDLVKRVWDRIDTMFGIGAFVGDIAVGRERDWSEEMEEVERRYGGSPGPGLLDFAGDWDAAAG